MIIIGAYKNEADIFSQRKYKSLIFGKEEMPKNLDPPVNNISQG